MKSSSFIFNQLMRASLVVLIFSLIKLCVFTVTILSRTGNL